MAKQSAIKCLTLLIITFLCLSPFECLSEEKSDFATITCTIPGTIVSCDKLVSNLPWQFSIEEKAGGIGQILYLSPKGIPLPGMHLKISLGVSNYSSQDAATKAFSQTCKNADPDIGISYGWDLVMIRKNRIFHLHADCTLAEQYFESMVQTLAEIVEPSGKFTSPLLLCRCGGGCKQPK